MSSKEQIFDFILKSRLLPAIGVISSLLGVVAYFLPWSSLGHTGLDLLTGGADGMSGFQAYLPTAHLVLMAVILLLSAWGVLDKARAPGPYAMMLFGFVGLVLVVAFGYWTPMDGYRMILNGGAGFYLGMFACVVYIMAGIVGYSVRPVVPSPARSGQTVQRAPQRRRRRRVRNR